MSRSREVAQLIVRDELRRAPRTSLNVPIGQSRRYAVIRTPADELKVIGGHLDRLAHRRGAGSVHKWPARASQPPAPAPFVPRASASELTVPTGAPNETVNVTTDVSASPQETWALLEDFPRMSRCMPGVELDTEEGDDTYSGRVRVHLGPLRMNFAGAARVLERDPEGRRLRAVAAGREASGSGIRAVLTLSAQPRSEGGTTVRAEARLYLSGRAAQFGRSLAGDVSRQLFAEFGACVERTLRSREAVAPARMSGGALAWRLMRARARAMLRRIFGRKPGS